MSILLGLFTAALVMLCALLGFIILLQRPRNDGGMGAAMGGGAAEQVFGAESGNVLTKLTIWFSVIFLVGSLLLFLGFKYQHIQAQKKESALPAFKTEAPVPAPVPAPALTPAPAAPAEPAPAAPSPAPEAPKP